MNRDACAHELNRTQTNKLCLIYLLIAYQSAPIHLLGSEIVQVDVNGED